jgi:hypothetical protein
MSRVFLAVTACLLVFTACRRQNSGFTEWSQTLQLPTGVAATELPDSTSVGALLTANYCSQCHGIPNPAMHSAEDWGSTVRRMIQRMERSSHMGNMMGGRRARGMPMGMAGASVPDQQARREILSYLQRHALQTLGETELPDASNPGAATLSLICAQCHALPDPRQHTREEWPAVVERMRRHMRDLNVGDISDGDAQQILGYLQQNAGP